MRRKLIAIISFLLTWIMGIYVFYLFKPILINNDWITIILFCGLIIIFIGFNVLIYLRGFSKYYNKEN
jgi:hypothetical protein